MLRSRYFVPGGKWRVGAMVFFVFCVLFFVGQAFPVFAQGLSSATNETAAVAEGAGMQNSPDLMTVIGRVINIVLSLIGVVLLVFILYAGFIWMTAGGSAEKVESAKKIIRNAIIGLVILLASFAITSFIMNLLGQNGGLGGTSTSGGSISGGGFSTSAGSLGAGIIESHYPGRNTTGVPRNAAIIVTFKKPIKISSVIQDYNDAGTPNDRTDDTVTEGVNDSSVKIYRTGLGKESALTSAQVRVRFTDDRKTFVFRPVEPLGSASEEVGYSVSLLSGLSGILLENGSAAFTGSFSDGYEWEFETSTLIDVTPPKIRSVFPKQGMRADRNVVISILFDEAIDPTTVSGDVASGFSHIAVYGNGLDGAPVDGGYLISNQYRTVEFVPSLSCGRNTCGEDMYCLPEGGGVIDAVVHSATLDGSGPTAAFLAAGYDGVVDVAGNSFDGNADGKTQGKTLDDYSWGFGITNNINLTPPTVEEALPSADADNEDGRSNIDPFSAVSVRFDTILQGSTWNTDNAKIVPHEGTEYGDTFWWTTEQDYLTDTNVSVATAEDIPAKSFGVFRHRMFATSTLYDPYLYSGIRNVYQNCFNPAKSSSCTGSPNCCLNRASSEECDFSK